MRPRARGAPTLGTGIFDSPRIAYSGGVAVQTDDKIVVAGGNSIQRFMESGAPDITYGQAGSVTTGPAEPYGYYRVVTVGAADTILAAGLSTKGGRTDVAWTRLVVNP